MKLLRSKPALTIILAASIFLGLQIQNNTRANAGQDLQRVVISAGGNSWVVGDAKATERVINDAGISNWSRKDERIRTYFYLNATGKLNLSIKARANSGESRIKVKLGNRSFLKKITNARNQEIKIGSTKINQTGYHFVEFEGIEKKGEHYPLIESIILSGKAAESARVQYIKDEFYFGRRGPSAHLRWRIPTGVSEVKWFYNEIIVPEGDDVIGSYFMANGFSGGYFGIQVNSKSQRKILFSVWSPYKTDDPKKIPVDFRVKLLRKGENVITGVFGNEGSGGQSYRNYIWKAGKRYRFLTKGEPSKNDSTDYTSYFYAPEIGKWELIASFRRPKTSSYIERPYSFLENFIPFTGDKMRKVFFANQWVADKNETWFKVNEAQLTADATARKGARLDYGGGIEGNNFYLENCGFFNGGKNVNETFTRRINDEQESKIPISEEELKNLQ